MRKSVSTRPRDRAPKRFETPSGVIVGDAMRNGRLDAARLPQDVRLQHVYVVGQTGTGKSTLLLQMLLHDIGLGHGVTVLDPHGSLVDALLERIPEDRLGDDWAM